MEEIDLLNQLASEQGRKDEALNIDLANTIVSKKDTKVIRLLIEFIKYKKNAIKSDSIKVLYEIGVLNAKLISPQLDEFISFLDHKNNRVQWGAMISINHIADYKVSLVHPHLGVILDAADRGSVITRDNAINILISFLKGNTNYPDIFPLLIEQLSNCPINQLPMYAERSMAIINKQNKAVFVKTLLIRFNDIEKESKKKRLNIIIKKLSNK